MTNLRYILDQVILNAYSITLDQLSKQALVGGAPPSGPGQPNRVYIGASHHAPPGARIYTSASGRQFWLPRDPRSVPAKDQGQQLGRPTHAQTEEQGAQAARYKHTIDLLTAKQEQLTTEIQQHLQHAAESPVDPEHLHKLNAKLSQIEQELQDAQSRYDEATAA